MMKTLSNRQKLKYLDEVKLRNALEQRKTYKMTEEAHEKLSDVMGFTENESKLSTAEQMPSYKADMENMEFWIPVGAEAESKPPSGVLQRVMERRGAKHEQRWNEWLERIASINQDMEKRSADLLEKVREELEQLHENHSKTLELFNDVTHLKAVPQDELIAEEEKTLKDLADNIESINQLEQNLMEIEAERFKQIRSEFQNLSEHLSEHSHMDPVKLYRLLKEEMLRVNAELLGIKRNIVELIGNWRTEEENRNTRITLEHKELRMKWKKYKLDQYSDEFKSFIREQNDEITVLLRNSLHQLIIRQKQLCKKEDLMLEEIRVNSEPPTLDESYIESWSQRFVESFEAEDEENAKCLRYLREILDENQKILLDKGNHFKQKIDEDKLLNDTEETEAFMQEHYYSTIRQMQHLHESVVNILETCCSWTTEANSSALCVPVVLFVKTLEKLWRVFGRNPLHQVKESFVSRLKIQQEAADVRVKRTDGKLLDLTEQLTRGDSEKNTANALNDIMKEVKELKQSYEAKKYRQIDVLKTYPQEMDNLILAYQEACCKFFGVEVIKDPQPEILLIESDANIAVESTDDSSALHPDQYNLETVPRHVTAINHAQFLLKERRDAIRSFAYRATSKKKNKSLDERKAFFMELKLDPTRSGLLGNELPECLEEMNVEALLDKGWLDQEGTENPEQEHFAELLRKVRPKPLAAYEETIHSLKGRSRENFLGHMLRWRKQLKSQIQEELDAWLQNIHSEYESEVEAADIRVTEYKKIYENRLQELSHHRERMKSHSKAVESVLRTLPEMVMSGLRSKLDDILAELKAFNEAFRENQCNKTTRSTQYKALFEKAEKVHLDKIDQVDKCLQRSRDTLAQLVSDLMQSNKDYANCLQTFDKGGNFAKAEAERYKAELATIGKSILSAQNKIKLKLEDLRRSYTASCASEWNTLRARISLDTNALVYSENIAAELRGVSVKLIVERSENQRQSDLLDGQIKKLQELMSEFKVTSPEDDDFVEKVFQQILINNVIPKHTQKDEKMDVQKEIIALLEQINQVITARCKFLRCNFNANGTALEWETEHEIHRQQEFLNPSDISAGPSPVRANSTGTRSTKNSAHTRKRSKTASSKKADESLAHEVLALFNIPSSAEMSGSDLNERVRDICHGALEKIINLSKEYYENALPRRSIGLQRNPQSFQEAIERSTENLCQQFSQILSIEREEWISGFSTQLFKLSQLVPEFLHHSTIRLLNQAKNAVVDQFIPYWKEKRVEMRHLQNLKNVHLTKLKREMASLSNQENLEALKSAEEDRQNEWLNLLQHAHQSTSNIVSQADERFAQSASGYFESLSANLSNMFCTMWIPNVGEDEVTGEYHEHTLEKDQRVSGHKPHFTLNSTSTSEDPQTPPGSPDSRACVQLHANLIVKRCTQKAIDAFHRFGGNLHQLLTDWFNKQQRAATSWEEEWTETLHSAAQFY